MSQNELIAQAEKAYKEALEPTEKAYQEAKPQFEKSAEGKTAQKGG